MISKEFLEKYNLPTIEEFRAGMEVGETEELYYRQILIATDHVSLKIFETFIENMAAASTLEIVGVIVDFFKDVKNTYADALTARKTAREKINEFEKTLIDKKETQNVQRNNAVDNLKNNGIVGN